MFVLAEKQGLYAGAAVEKSATVKATPVGAGESLSVDQVIVEFE